MMPYKYYYYFILDTRISIYTISGIKMSEIKYFKSFIINIYSLVYKTTTKILPLENALYVQNAFIKRRNSQNLTTLYS